MIAGPNPRRVGIIISVSPSVGFGNQPISAIFHNSDINGGGHFLSYTCPAGYTAVITSYNLYIGAGGGNTVFADITPSGGLQTAYQYLGGTNYTSPGIALSLNPGDRFSMFTQGGGGAELVDAMIFGIAYPILPTLYVSLLGPAVAGAGLVIQPGTLPLALYQEHIGQAVTETIYAVASVACTVNVIDIFEDCDCPSMVMADTMRGK